MTEASGADSGSAEGIGCYVEDDIVGTSGIARNPAYAGKMIQPEIVAHAPSDVVVSTGSVTANAHATDDYLARAIERQTAAEHVHSADFVSNHRVICSANLLGWPRVCIRSIHGIAVLQSIQTAPGLNGRVQVCRRERETVGLT